MLTSVVFGSVVEELGWVVIVGVVVTGSRDAEESAGTGADLRMDSAAGWGVRTTIGDVWDLASGEGLSLVAGADCTEVVLSARVGRFLADEATDGVFDSTDGVADVRLASS